MTKYYAIWNKETKDWLVIWRRGSPAIDRIMLKEWAVKKIGRVWIWESSVGAESFQKTYFPQPSHKWYQNGEFKWYEIREFTTQDALLERCRKG